ncbi:MAG TPA: hypothetical protein PK246_10585 [Saprospiraceae bacterium]|nr:hypothetical protein [Saprospiraceae bacterium]
MQPFNRTVENLYEIREAMGLDASMVTGQYLMSLVILNDLLPDLMNSRL